jgi:capsular polysaccharide transport system permease protein
MPDLAPLRAGRGPHRDQRRDTHWRVGVGYNESSIQAIVAAFLLQGQVIWALVLREMHTRYGRENLGYLWIVGEPILFCAGVAIVWTLIRPAHEHGMPMTAFVITGYVPLTMWRHCVMRAMKAFEANGSLLFHRQVTPLDIILARVLLEVAGTLMAGFLVGGGAILIGFMDAPKDYPMMCMGLVYYSFFSLGCALLIAPLSERSDLVEKLIAVLMYLSLPLSGVFGMVSWFPQSVRGVLLASPSVQALEMIRGGQFGPASHPLFNLPYATASIGVMCVVGLSLTLRSRRFIVVQ